MTVENQRYFEPEQGHLIKEQDYASLIHHIADLWKEDKLSPRPDHLNLTEDASRGIGIHFGVTGNVGHGGIDGHFSITNETKESGYSEAISSCNAQDDRGWWEIHIPGLRQPVPENVVVCRKQANDKYNKIG